MTRHRPLGTLWLMYWFVVIATNARLKQDGSIRLPFQTLLAGMFEWINEDEEVIVRR